MATITNNFLPRSIGVSTRGGAASSSKARPLKKMSTSTSTTTRKTSTTTRKTLTRATASTPDAHARDDAKKALLSAIEPLERGVKASDEEKARVDALATALEALNPNPNSLAAPCINGEWELVYTTSASILGTNKPAFLRPSGRIFQTIDAESLRARNRETWPFYNAVAAELTPTSSSAVKVQFKKFFVFGGLIKVTAPERARGALDITYVDDEVRVSRGDKGNLFVLTMHDNEKRLPNEEASSSLKVFSS
jgi:hypothetical protein